MIEIGMHLRWRGSDEGDVRGRQTFKCEFTPRVEARGGQAVEAAYAADIDDSACFLGAEKGHCRADQAQGAEEVGFELGVGFFVTVHNCF